MTNALEPGALEAAWRTAMAECKRQLGGQPIPGVPASIDSWATTGDTQSLNVEKVAEAAIRAYLAATPEAAVVADEQVKHMVGRFLSWKLPADFSPDAGISFTADYNETTPWPAKHEPTGTNLFDARQAEAMVRYMLEGTALAHPPADEVRAATIEECAALIEEGFSKVVGESYATSSFTSSSLVIRSENDQCPHSRYMFEDCDQCCADAIRALASQPAPATGEAMEALRAAETIMMMVEPRSHKAEYLAVLDKVRAALAGPSNSPSEQHDGSAMPSHAVIKPPLEWVEDARIRAGLPGAAPEPASLPSHAGEVVIKPLVWPNECKRGKRVAGGNLLIYVIAHYGGDGPETVYRWAADGGGGWSEAFQTYDEAKAAAQKDYEQRIRSALVGGEP